MELAGRGRGRTGAPPVQWAELPHDLWGLIINFATANSPRTAARLVQVSPLMRDLVYDYLEALDLTAYSQSPRATLGHYRHLRELALPYGTGWWIGTLPPAVTMALNFLSLVHCPLDSTGLAQLATMTSLRNLNLANTQLDDQALAHLSRLTALSTLDLSDNRVSDDGLRHLRHLPALTWLDISCCAVTAGGLKHLAHNTKLTSLNLGYCRSQPDPDRIDLTPLHRLPHLTELHVHCVALSVEEACSLKRFPALKHLSVRSCWLTQEHLVAMFPLPHVTTLRIRNSLVSSIDGRRPSLAPIFASRSLTTLCLRDNNITDRMLQATAEDELITQPFLPHVTCLDLSDNTITAAGLAVLQDQMPALTHLIFMYTSRSLLELECLATFPGLTRLDIDIGQLNSAQYEKLRAVTPAPREDSHQWELNAAGLRTLLEIYREELGNDSGPPI